MQALRVQNVGWAKRAEGGAVALLGKGLSALVRMMSGQKMTGENHFSIAEKISLGPKKNLFLVHCDGRRFLVATGADTVAAPVELAAKSSRKSAMREGGE